MAEPWLYEIRVEGHLADRWSDWFEGLAMRREGDQTVLTGWLADQAALHGVLRRISDMNLLLVSVVRLRTADESPSP